MIQLTVGIIILSIVIATILYNARQSTKRDHAKFSTKGTKETPLNVVSGNTVWTSPTEGDRWEPFPTRPTGLTVVVHDEQSDLEEELKRALEDEDYLLAAAIRDELKALEENNNRKKKIA